MNPKEETAMNFRYPKTIALAAVASVGFAGAAFADCSADLAKLDSALKGTSLNPQAKGDLESARAKAAELLKAHDDKGCSKAIVDAIAKAGVKM
jgi:hypothetical protein